MRQATITTQRAVRQMFWEQFESCPGISRRKIRDYAGTGKMHNTDTRCAFCDFVDNLRADGLISEALADRVTL